MEAPEEGLRLSNPPPAEPEVITASCEIPLQFTFRKECPVKENIPANNEMMDLEIIAKITAKDGTVIEKKSVLPMPSPDLMILSSVPGKASFVTLILLRGPYSKPETWKDTKAT